MERTETETRQRLNSQIERLERELTQFKKKLAEEVEQRHMLGRNQDVRIYSIFFLLHFLPSFLLIFSLTLVVFFSVSFISSHFFIPSFFPQPFRSVLLSLIALLVGYELNTRDDENIRPSVAFTITSLKHSACFGSARKPP